MKNIKQVTLNELQTYIANNIILMPIVQQQYFEQLEDIKRQGKVSLLPVMILNRYNERLKRRPA